MSVTVAKSRNGLSREESRAQIRAALIAFGCMHFLHQGFGGARTARRSVCRFRCLDSQSCSERCEFGQELK
jgi:hypothetical protein